MERISKDTLEWLKYIPLSIEQYFEYREMMDGDFEPFNLISLDHRISNIKGYLENVKDSKNAKDIDNIIWWMSNGLRQLYIFKFSLDILEN